MPGLEFMGQGVRRIRWLQAREALVVPEWPLASILGQYASDSEDDNADAGSAAAADGDGCDDDDAAAVQGFCRRPHGSLRRTYLCGLDPPIRSRNTRAYT